jgi:AraC-like DNA-binding protein
VEPHDASIDYASPGAWDGLGELFSRLDARPTNRRGNVRCGPGWLWQVDLTDFDLWLAVAGRGRFRLGGTTYPVQAGTLFWLRPGDDGLATQEPDDPLTVVYVHFDFFAAGGEAAAVGPDRLPGRHIPLTDVARMESLLARIVRLQQLPTPLSAVEARTLLHLALIDAYRQDAVNRGELNVRPDPRVATVLQRLHRAPADRLSLNEAAGLANLSADHFSRLFRAQTGIPFRRYGVDVRLDRARHLLEETSMTVSEIAEALGYDDVFLFSRQCKARFGVAPSRLRGARPAGARGPGAGGRGPG